MRIRTVTLEGFGPFKERQSIAFGAFDADGLFLIAGETGVGKSSILDAIAYALYNRTPRWDNVSATGASNAVRSDFCGVDDPTEVIVEFETGGQEYRVTRAPEYERPKARGKGTTRQSARILVEVFEAGAWVGRATKEREAAELIEGLLKLNKDEFLQVIMLAQGRFQEFLLATSEQRLELLSKLFGTGRFADYQARIAGRRSALQKQVEQSRMQRTVLLDGIQAPDELGPAPETGEQEWLASVIEHGARAVAEATARIEAAETAEQAAHTRLDLARRQARRAAAEQALAQLTAQRETLDAEKVRLQRAERAEHVLPLIEDANLKDAAQVTAVAAVESARLGYEGEVGDEGLAAEVSRLTELLGSLAETLREEQRLETLAEQLATAQAEAQRIAGQLAQSGETITTLREEQAELAPKAAQAEPAAEALDQAQRRLTAAQQAAAVLERQRKAEQDYLAADRRAIEARAAANALLQRFLHGQAAVLAAELVPGEPCSVCGSAEHPAPAKPTDDAVGRDEVDEAQAAVEPLEAKAKEAKARAEELKVEAAALAGAAGAEDLEQLEAAVAQARSSLEAVTAAAARVTEIDERLVVLTAESAALTAAAAEAATEVTRLQTEHAALEAAVVRSREGYASVAERHAALVAERDAARALVEALAALASAETQRAESHRKLAALLSREKFDSAETAAAAALDTEAMAELEERIEAHAAAVSESRGILKQPELQDLPAEVIVEEDAASGHREAQVATKAALTARANAESALRGLESKQRELAQLHAQTKELVGRYEALHRLAETVNGRSPNTKSMSLESYYVAAELEDVLAAANQRLRELSKGRFELRHTERGVRRAGAAAGLEIEVFDEFTGTARPANQLSGGQQFLASLALALGLAEVVTSRAGGIELNTLFVDEGFGSLSAEYLEIAMETLDSLKQGGRTVGVISHVASMQEQIAAKLLVVAEPGGPSRIVQAD